ncbi:hypothetical protein T484DRAFT_1886116 [Baffinella frigidus]|nr:hypothetical protein T484DRAFT_1886116 [Cryptophyta sp. CCMP2293]
MLSAEPGDAADSPATPPTLTPNSPEMEMMQRRIDRLELLLQTANSTNTPAPGRGGSPPQGQGALTWQSAEGDPNLNQRDLFAAVRAAREEEQRERVVQEVRITAERAREREAREERAAKAAHERETARAHAARELALREKEKEDLEARERDEKEDGAARDRGVWEAAEEEERVRGVADEQEEERARANEELRSREEGRDAAMRDRQRRAREWSELERDPSSPPSRGGAPYAGMRHEEFPERLERESPAAPPRHGDGAAPPHGDDAPPRGERERRAREWSELAREPSSPSSRPAAPTHHGDAAHPPHGDDALPRADLDRGAEHARTAAGGGRAGTGRGHDGDVPGAGIRRDVIFPGTEKGRDVGRDAGCDEGPRGDDAAPRANRLFGGSEAFAEMEIPERFRAVGGRGAVEAGRAAREPLAPLAAQPVGRKWEAWECASLERFSG